MQRTALLLVALIGCTSPSAPDRVASVASAYTAGQWSTMAAPSYCADGSQALFGVNPSPSPTGRLVFVGIGEGICDAYGGWMTCPAVSPGSASTPHANASDWAGWTASGTGQLVTGLLDRSNTASPFYLDDWVGVPVCTNDAWLGTTTATYGSTTWHHYGAALLAAGLAEASSLYPSPSGVVVYGYSAGGMGAVVNAGTIAGAWPGKPIALIDDSGPWLGSTYVSIAGQQAMLGAWGANLPAGCTNCAPVTGSPSTGLINAWAYAASIYSPAAYIGSQQDAVISRVLSSVSDNGLTCSPAHICGSGYNQPCPCDYGLNAVSPSTQPAVYEWLSAVTGAGSSGMVIDDSGGHNWQTVHIVGTGAKSQSANGGPLGESPDGGAGACSVTSFVAGVLGGTFAAPCSGDVQ